MQPLKRRIRDARCKRNNAKGLRELGRRDGQLLLLPLKLHIFLLGSRICEMLETSEAPLQAP